MALETYPVETEPVEREPEAGPRRWKWTGDDLIRLSSLGLLPRERRFELMDGEIIERMAPSPLHACLVGLVGELLSALAWGEPVFVRQENPVRLSQYFQPEPDLAVIRGRRLDYRDRFPEPGELLLLVEIADTSLAYDRSQKLRAYAAAGIPEYWLVDLRNEQVEVYREPDVPEYRSRRTYKPGETLAPLSAPEAALPVSALLGQP